MGRSLLPETFAIAGAEFAPRFEAQSSGNGSVLDNVSLYFNKIINLHFHFYYTLHFHL